MALKHNVRMETILLVEDDPLVLNFLLTCLRHAGFTVLAAAGPEAARRIENGYAHIIALLLCDVVMPHTYGPDLARELLARRPEMRVILMSGNTEDSHRLHYRGLFLQKPFTPAALLRTIEEALHSELGGAMTG